MLSEREHERTLLAERAAAAAAGRGGLVLITAESGGGKTSFVESFLDDLGGDVWWGGCDPLSTPRPLGPIHQVSAHLTPVVAALLRDGTYPHAIFDAVFRDLARQPVVLVVDDLHWADQATIDLLRFVLRRIGSTSSLVIGTARDDEIATDHPLRSLLGDVARSPHAITLPLPPLSVDAVGALAGDRPIDPVWLHRITGGNPFFVVEMLDHVGGDLPTTVRDAILARTVGLDRAAWDLLHLLVCAPEGLPDRLLAPLGVSLPALRTLAEANLIRRSERGVAFRHDLCRQAVASVVPPGAEAAIHERVLHALDAVPPVDPASITHHALGAGDLARVASAATEAGRASARSGAHTQAHAFYRTALDRGGPLPPASRAEVLELLAGECYLIDRLDEAIDACRQAMLLRTAEHAPGAVSANHHSLAVYEWYQANRAAADDHAASAVAALDGSPVADSDLATLGHALMIQAYLAMQRTDLDTATSLVARAQEIADRAGDPSLVVRARLIANLCAVLRGQRAGRDTIISIVSSAPEEYDEIYSGGYTNLAYLDVEQRRLGDAADLLGVSLPMTVERDLPICYVWQLGARGRMSLLRGEWPQALADADLVLERRSAPVARTWPLLIRALVELRCRGGGSEELDEACRLASRYAEPIRLFPAASAVAERAWLTGVSDERLAAAASLLDGTPHEGLEWARGELAVWLRRLDVLDGDGPGGLAEPYRLLLDGDWDAAADAFLHLGTPYDAALALADAGDEARARRAVDLLDRIGAAAVADKVRRDVRARGAGVVPARRRTSTLTNPVGLTARQVEVLQAMDGGATNAELAAQLYLSPKTVDHHVSAILMKLEVSNRRDAVRRGRELGIIA